MIIEGATEKVLQIKVPLKSIHSKNLCLLNNKMYFGTPQRCSNNKKLIIGIILVMKNFSGELFRAALYRIMLSLNRDALFHCVSLCVLENNLQEQI